MSKKIKGLFPHKSSGKFEVKVKVNGDWKFFCLADNVKQGKRIQKGFKKIVGLMSEESMF